MGREHESSTVIDTEFDVIEELTGALNEIEKGLGDRKDLLAKTSYMRFLVKELADNLSGGFETLRHRRFITKKSE